MLDRRVPLSQTMDPSLLAHAVRWRGSNRFRDSRPAYHDPDRTPFPKTNDGTSVAKFAVAAIPSLSPPRRPFFPFTDSRERRLLVFEFLSPECRGQSPKIPAIRTAERMRVRAIYGQDQYLASIFFFSFPIRAARARHFWLTRRTYG